MNKYKIYDQYIEERIQKSFKSSNSHWNFLLKEQVQNLKEYCDNNSISPRETEKLLDVADDFLHNLFCAFDSDYHENVEKPKNLWFHAELTDGLFKGLKSKEAKFYEKIDIDALCVCARMYLQNQWLRNDTLDWIFVDSLSFYLIWNQTQAFLERDFISSFINYFSSGSFVKTTIFKFIFSTFSFLLRFILPILLIIIFYSTGQAGLGNFTAATFVLFLLIKFSSIPQIKKDKDKLIKNLSSIEEFSKTYLFLGSTTINLESFLSRIEKLTLEVPLIENYIVPIIKRSLKKGNQTIFVWNAWD